MSEGNSQVTMRVQIRSIAIAAFAMLTTVGIAGIAKDKETKPNDSWRDSVDLAEQLKARDDEASFDVLLGLLGNSHTDVRYAAAKSLEARAQTKWAKRLTEAVSKMDSNDCWFGYRALRAYPTKDTLLFLADALKKEFDKIEDKGFDTRNYFYISQSIDKIVQAIEKKSDATTQPPAVREKSTSQFCRARRA